MSEFSTDNIKMITELISKGNTDIKEHFNTQLRMLKLTTSETHKVAVETRELAKKTNGRVSKLEDVIYGEINPKTLKPIEGKYGLICLVEKYKKNGIKIAAASILGLLSLEIPQFKTFIMKIIDKIF